MEASSPKDAATASAPTDASTMPYTTETGPPLTRVPVRLAASPSQDTNVVTEKATVERVLR